MFIKGTCNFIPSERIQPKPVFDAGPHFCFNATTKIVLYILLPGKKIFVSAYHPLKVLEALELSGAYYFRVAINTKQIEMVPDRNDCQNIDKNVDSVFGSYDRFEQWYKF